MTMISKRVSFFVAVVVSFEIGANAFWLTNHCNKLQSNVFLATRDVFFST